MEINPTVLAILVSVASAILGAAGVDLYIHCKNKTKRAIEKKKKERQDEMKEAILPCIEEAIKPMSDKIDTVEKDVQEIKNDDLPKLKMANRDSLRNQLFATYRHCDKIGYRTTEDTENFLHMKDSYEKLGGNGVIADIHEQFMNLPLENLESVKYKAQQNNKRAKKTK